MDLRISPDLPGFRAAASEAGRRVVSVHARLLADDLTPVGLYHQLCGDAPGTFLFESADNGQWSRYSFVGVRSAATLAESGGEAAWTWSDRPIDGLPRGGDPLAVVRETLAGLEARLDPARFARVHRSEIVAVEAVAEIQPLFHGDHEVVLRNGDRVRMSRRYQDRLLGT